MSNSLMAKKYDYTHRHDDDEWIDEIRLSSDTKPLLRLFTCYRYKTSGLSGDEWRTSTMWQCIEGLMIGNEENDGTPGWFNFDGPYYKLSAGCAALYPGLYSSQRHAHNLPIHYIDFLRKGRVLYRSSYDNQPMTLLVVAGHLSWALMQANDQPLGTAEAWEDVKKLCHQPGCSNLAVSTYRLQYLYDRSGKKSEIAHMTPLVRRFCPIHLCRGDCGLEDADSNYEVLEGPGPNEAVGWRDYQSQSSVIVLDDL
jgi:hypothetical protein